MQAFLLCSLACFSYSHFAVDFYSFSRKLHVSLGGGQGREQEIANKRCVIQIRSGVAAGELVGLRLREWVVPRGEQGVRRRSVRVAANQMEEQVKTYLEASALSPFA